MLKNKTSVVDDRGYNQGFKETAALKKRMERRADWMINEMNAEPGKKILEIGCGTGYLSYYIAKKTGMQVIGSDLCKPFIEDASKKYVLPNLSYDTLDFNKAAASVDDRFDYIIGNGILHHLYYNLNEVLVTLKKLLNSQGKIIFMEPNIYNPYVAAIFKNKRLRKWARLEPDEMAFSKKFIYGKLKEAGFRNIKGEYKDFLLPGIPSWLIKPSIIIGDFLEKTPLKFISQSILIKAVKEE
ncbi:MAG TPA: methyltransferase domain-containing protein [Chitinophagaceae bacterium]|jgi:2-polyprenyl-3-methyl-5-hydroxy-6-metoxy-1,4-benzoquinol methylase|nr:methyltransferase domain-containing protein [Chitinophagaceae bacterium]